MVIEIELQMNVINQHSVITKIWSMLTDNVIMITLIHK